MSSSDEALETLHSSPADSCEDGDALVADEPPDSDEEALELSGSDSTHESQCALALAEDSATDHDGVDEIVVGARSWRPGVDVGEWVGREHPLQEQSQVLVANVALALRSLAQNLLGPLCQAIGLGSSSSPRYLRIASGLLRLSGSAIWRCTQALARAGFVPVPRPPVDSDCGSRNGLGPNDSTTNTNEQSELLVLVRSALASTLSGVGTPGYLDQLSALSLAGVSVGHKFHTDTFRREVQHLAFQSCQMRDRLDSQQVLPGLGIPTDFAILFDGVPVGGTELYGRHGSVQVICTSGVSCYSGKLHARFITWAMSSSGHAGSATAQNILDALAADPDISVETLQRRLTCIGGDGAVVRGGAGRRKPGTQAADIMWFKIFPARVPDDADVLAALGRPGNPAVPRREQEAPHARHNWLDDASTLYCATEWDKFHREDLALRRAIEETPLAVDLFDTCARMDGLFGFGDGRLLLRAVAQGVGVQARDTRMPGMTRKAVQLSEEPANFLHNFKPYAYGLHVREEWRKEGHAGVTHDKLIEHSTALFRFDVICFALLLRDIMSKVVAPWAKLIQGNSVEPWTVRHMLTKKQRKCREAQEALHAVREVLRVLVLLRQWVPVPTIRHMTRAFFFARPADIFPESHPDQLVFGRVFPAFFSAVNEFLSNRIPTYQRVQLRGSIPDNLDEFMCLGPHCMCLVGTDEGAGDAPPGVARGIPPRGEDTQSRHPEPAPVRFRWRKRTLPLPPNLQGVLNLLRPTIRSQRGGLTSRCQVPNTLPFILQDIDQAVVATQRFLGAYREHETRLFGVEGENAGYAKAVDLMCQCFDWGRFVNKTPSVADVNAVGELYSLLRPYLELSLMPDWPEVAPSWPDVSRFQYQYVVLMSRVRRARSVPHISRPWYTIKDCQVSLLGAFEGLRVFTIKVFGSLYDGRGPRPMTASRMLAMEVRVRVFWMRVAYVLPEFLGEDLGRCENSNPQPIPRRSLRVSWPMLLRSGHCRPTAKLRGSRLQFQYGSGEPGNLATTTAPGVCGKVVHVGEVFRELNWAEVSAAIDMHPFFARQHATTSESKADVLPDCAWHAARLHHRCRSFCSAEACCERVGSTMKEQWQRNSHRHLQRFMEATLLRSTGVMGSSGCAFDEQLCRDICGAMEDLGRWSPVTKAKGGDAVSRPLQARRDACEGHLVELGRVARVERKPAAVSDSDSECEVASDSSDGLAPEQASKRSRIARDVTRSLSGGILDIGFVVRRANAKMRPSLVLPLPAEQILRRDTTLAPFHPELCPSRKPTRTEKIDIASSGGAAGSAGVASSSTTRVKITLCSPHNL